MLHHEQRDDQDQDSTDPHDEVLAPFPLQILTMTVIPIYFLPIMAILSFTKITKMERLPMSPQKRVSAMHDGERARCSEIMTTTETLTSG